MKYVAKIGIGNKVNQLSLIDPNDEMTESGALQHIKDITKQDNWVIAPNELCGVGCYYDDEAKTFTLPKPFASWTWDTTKKCWVAPIEQPENADYWNEENQTWV